MLAELFQPSDRTIAFVGVAKNAGKTTAMSALLEEWEDAGETLGLMSVGIDGETADFVSGMAKPAISVSRDTLVATTDQMLRRSSVAVDVLGTTGVRTPLGELVIARVRRAGDVVLAGLRHRADVRAMTQALRAEGATRVLIDGAFDRLAAADPETADRVVICTGMVFGGDIDLTADRSAALTEVLRLPPLSVALPADLDGVVALRWAREWRASGADSLLAWDFDAKEGAPDAVYAPGLVTDAGLARVAAALSPNGEFVVRDGTRLLCGAAARRRFVRRRTISVLRTIDVAAVTVNPRRPDGSRVDVAALAAAVFARVSPIPVIDVRTGYCAGPGTPVG